jgi:uncharacterized protein YcaQ
MRGELMPGKPMCIIVWLSGNVNQTAALQYNAANMAEIFLQIKVDQARRFLLLHQHLLPPRQLKGKSGILNFIQHVGCIQFDPVNVIGRNPDLVLQARIKDYQPEMLYNLLYRDYQLFDGWDKQSSVCRVEDWPYFARHHQRMMTEYWETGKPESKLAKELLEHIRGNGVHDPIHSKNRETILWNWGRPARLERAALEILFAVRKVHIADRVGNRRIYDLTERLMPPNILEQPDPNATLEEYHDWHVLRRIGGLGLAQAGSSEYWLGIQHMKSPERKATLERLTADHRIYPVSIAELPGKTFYVRREDVPILESTLSYSQAEPKASFLAPLDNLLWDRKLLSWIFGFDYVWEVYKKAEVRKYGYYTLPVLYGERFVARMEPSFNRKSKTMTIKDWWWEAGIKPGKEMKAALNQCLAEFMGYLGAEKLNLSDHVRTDRSLAWMK